MPSMEPGPGERALQSATRQKWRTMLVLAGCGAIVGFVAALVEIPVPDRVIGMLPPWFALGAAALTALAMAAGTISLHRRIDELDRADNHFAGAVACNVLLGGYPVWYLLWKGGWVGEPRHEIMYAILFFSAILTYGWRKLR